MDLFTHQQLVDLIQSRLEDEVLPATILAAIIENTGKKITVRFLDKLPGGRDRWCLSSCVNMVSVATRDYSMSGGTQGSSYLLSYDGKNAVFPTAEEFQKYNSCYYEGLRKRNAQREEFLNSKQQQVFALATINYLIKAKNEFDKALAQFKVLTEYGKPLDPEDHVLEKMILGDEKN